jgi:hypothetical protein
LARDPWEPTHQSINFPVAENSWIHGLLRRADGIGDGIGDGIAAGNWEGKEQYRQRYRQIKSLGGDNKR